MDINTTIETINGRQFEVQWYFQDSVHWASTYLNDIIVKGGGCSQDEALSQLIDLIECIGD